MVVIQVPADREDPPNERERRKQTYFGRTFRNILRDRGITQREFVEHLNRSGWPQFHQQEASNWLYSDTLPSYVMFAVNAGVPDLTSTERTELEWASIYGKVPLTTEQAEIIKRWQRGERLSGEEWDQILPAYERVLSIRDRTKKQQSQQNSPNEAHTDPPGAPPPVV